MSQGACLLLSLEAQQQGVPLLCSLGDLCVLAADCQHILHPATECFWHSCNPPAAAHHPALSSHPGCKATPVAAHLTLSGKADAIRGWGPVWVLKHTYSSSRYCGQQALHPSPHCRAHRASLYAPQPISWATALWCGSPRPTPAPSEGR